MTQHKLFGRLHYSKLLVLNLQRRLRARGLDPGEIDGRWSQETETALEQAQHAYGVYGGKADAAYFVVISVPPEDLAKVAEQVILLGAPETGVYQRNHPHDPKVAVGPFFNEEVAKRWQHYLRDFGLSQAQVYYGC
ncbi:MAG: peptidoglycan-binding domain-containing protein [Microcoleaceae cyanobacterium]